MDNKALIEKFYRCFASADAEGMVSCYADGIEFKDPAFGVLKGDDTKNMWRMLLKHPDIKVTVNNIQANDATGSANWVAVYTFSRTGRKLPIVLPPNLSLRMAGSPNIPISLTYGNGPGRLWV